MQSQLRPNTNTELTKIQADLGKLLTIPLYPNGFRTAAGLLVDETKRPEMPYDDCGVHALNSLLGFCAFDNPLIFMFRTTAPQKKGIRHVTHMFLAIGTCELPLSYCPSV